MCVGISQYNSSILLFAVFLNFQAVFLAHVPVPLGHGSHSHTQLISQLHLEGVGPIWRLIEGLLEHLALIVVLAAVNFPA